MSVRRKGDGGPRVGGLPKTEIPTTATAEEDWGRIQRHMGHAWREEQSWAWTRQGWKRSLFSMLFLILRRHVRGFEVACLYERDQGFQGKGRISHLNLLLSCHFVSNMGETGPQKALRLLQNSPVLVSSE